MDDIVEKANYSRSTFFRYFDGKDDVVFLDLPDRLAAMMDALGSEVQGDPVRLAREALTRQTLEFAALAPTLEAACVELWNSEPALQRRFAELFLQMEDELTKFFATAWGDDPNISVEAAVLASAMVGVARSTLRLQLDDSDLMASVLDRGFNLLEHGVRGMRRSLEQRQKSSA